jgi:chromosomal replication initiator protein
MTTAELEQRVSDLEQIVWRRFSVAVAPLHKRQLDCCLSVTAAHYGVSQAELMSESRLAKLVRPRHVAMYLARDVTKLPLNQLAPLFNRKNHGSVQHGFDRIQKKMRVNKDFRAEVNGLKSTVEVRAK